MRRILALVLMLATAGCATPAATPPTDDSTAPALTTLAGSVVGTLVEPAITVDENDDITIVTASTSITAWRGPANGSLAPLEARFDGPGDADLAASGSWVYHVGLVGEHGRVPFTRSQDGGATWADPVDLSRGARFGDRPFIAAADERVLVAWSGQSDNPGIIGTYSNDHGGTWNAIFTIAQPGTGSIGTVAVDSTSNRLLAAWSSDAPPGVFLSISTDEGSSWTPFQISGAPSRTFPTVAADATGNVYAAWSGLLDGSSPVAQPRFEGGVITGPPPTAMFASSTDGGKTWSPPLVMSEPGHAAWYPTIAAGPEGRVAISWYDVEIGRTDGRGVLALAVSQDATSDAPRFIRIDPTPEPVMFNIRCPDDLNCESGRNTGEVLDAAFRPTGTPVVAWAQWGESMLEVHYAAPTWPFTP